MAAPERLARLIVPWLRRRGDVPFELPGGIGDGSRILAVDAGDLSDLLFHAPLLRGLRVTYPLAQIDFLLPDGHAPLVVPSGLARQCLVYAPRQLRPWTAAFWGLLRSVRQTGYQAALVMSGGPAPIHELIALASGAALRVGPAHAAAHPAVNLEIRAGAASTAYRGDRPICAAPLLGIPETAARREWPLPPDRLRQARQLVGFHKSRPAEWIIGVDPGRGKCGAALAVSSLHFIVEQIAAHLPCRLLLLSTPEEASRMRQLEGALRTPPLTLPRDTLFETLLLLAQCDLLVAGNTDVFHFAVAMGVPTLGLFTAQDGEEWRPHGRSNLGILRLAPGQQIAIDTLLGAVQEITRHRETRAGDGAA